MSQYTMEECELLSDSKYRAYVSQVEKVLRNFESMSEWADLISALGKLNKVLQSQPKYGVIPKRGIIGKRLAQCLHPALPSGVHLKALETYAIIFKSIGPRRLSNDLFTYSSGLFPLLAYAAMNVKPSLLAIYEEYFVPLETSIKPGLSGLLLGLLPGLEEGSEHYDRTNLLLEQFCRSAGPTFFYGCLWECVLISPSTRLAAITFVIAHYNRKQTMEDQLFFMGTNIDAMVQALCVALLDVSVLVQRSFLDFLLLGFTMNNRQLNRPDMVKLVTAAIHTVLRRDMSLNRRLFAWFLGQGTSGIPAPSALNNNEHIAPGVTYFTHYSRDNLISSIRSILLDFAGEDPLHPDRNANLKPFRILISMLDKPDIGPAIIEDVLVDVFRCLYRECDESKNAPKILTKKKGVEEKSTTELLKTANLLFGTFEPFYLWDYLARKIEEVYPGVKKAAEDKRVGVLQSKPISVTELCQLVDFLVEQVSLEVYTETQTEYLPDLLRRLTTALTLNCLSLSYDEIIHSLDLCNKILTKVQPSMTMVEVESQARATATLRGSVMSSAPGEEEVYTDADAVTNGDVTLTVNSLRMRRDSSIEESSEFSENYVSAESDLDMERSPRRMRAKPRDPTDTTSTTLIQACVQAFQNFYFVFIEKRIFPDGFPLRTAMDHLLMKNESGFVGSSTDVSDDSAIGQETDSFVLDDLDLSAPCCEAIVRASQLLVEFSTFPMYCRDLSMVLDTTCKLGADVTFPPWLQALLTCCCYARHFDLLTSSVSTMLDLICLTQSVLDESTADQKGERNGRASEGTVAVVILPSLSPTMLTYLNSHSVFYKIVACRLWNYLSDKCPDYHQRAVELFYQLHQVAPTTWTCEDVIGAALVSDDMSQRVEGCQRFSVLWHLTRNQKPKSGLGHAARTFDRSMFLVLDSLMNDTDSTKSLTQTWLTHAVQRGDVARILEPILLLLLHPDSARVSIQHVDIHESRSVRHLSSETDTDIQDCEARIYAISSEGGNVIYHVGRQSRDKTTTARDKEIRSLSVTNTGNKVTSLHADTEMPFERVNPDDLKLRVNPFGSESSLDRIVFEGHANSNEFPDIRKVKRLDRETCKKEGISFDDENSGDEDERVEIHEITGQDIAKQIIEELLVTVFDRLVENEAVELQVSNQEEKTEEKAVSRVVEDDDFLLAMEQHVNPSEYDLIDASDVDAKRPDDAVLSSVHPLHTHILLYIQKYDCHRTLYAMTSLKSMLLANPRLVIFAISTTSLNSVRTPHLQQLQDLLVRHRRCIFGKNFYGDVTNDALSTYRNTMYVEILMSVCLYYIRSYYPNLMMSKLDPELLNANREVQIMSTEILSCLLSELVNLLKVSGKAFATFLSDLLSRCKVQKAILHCLLASVYNGRLNKETSLSHITEAIISFNERSMDSNTNETFQIRLLRLVLVMIVLEEHIKIQKGDAEPLSSTSTEWERPRVLHHPQAHSFKFVHAQSVAHQPMLLTTALSALKQQHLCHMHRHWIELVVMVMPYVGKALGNLVTSVVDQICRNLELLSALYDTGDGDKSSSPLRNIPVDHVITMLEGLTTLSHYCLLDQSSSVLINHQMANITDTTGSAQIFSNLIHVFTPGAGTSREPSPNKDSGQHTVASIIAARRGLLSILPRIIASLASLWRAIHKSEAIQRETQEQPAWTMGYPKNVRQHILEFLSPISIHHNVNLLAAVAVVWNDRRLAEMISLKRYVPSFCSDQMFLVDLVSNIKVLPTDTLVQTVKQVIKSPPPTSQDRNKKRTPLEVSMLQLFYTYVQQCAPGQLVDCWPSLLALIKDGLFISIAPPGQFLLLLILNEFVMKTPPFEDKKDHRDVQEITQKLLEACSSVAGSRLEQTTWFRRNLAVKTSLQKDLHQLDQHDDHDESDNNPDVSNINGNMDLINTAQYSVHALLLLAELTAPLLDIVYGSDEKERVVPFLTTAIMYNVFPYLKHHSMDNAPSYRACSQILASLSGYPYTRKAWKKEVFDIFMDSNFFKMTQACMPFWRTIIDNLMTHDKITFRDLMTRVTTSQSGSLHLFSSREAEYEQRAQLLKKLSYTIYCSETDQYQRYMPDIQERLSECLKLPHVPSIQAQVFLCFRVLLMRISPQHLTSLWPTIVTELVHVFLQMEQELSPDGDEVKMQLHRIATVDASWAFSNGLNAHNNPAWLRLYLSACKLLDLALVMPASLLPQFQLYRWAFIGDESDIADSGAMENQKVRNPAFVPHCLRIAELLNKRLGGDVRIIARPAGYPMLTKSYVRTIADLHPFFYTLQRDRSQSCIPITSENQQNLLRTNSAIVKSKSAPDFNSELAETRDWKLERKNKTWRDYVEELIEHDFLDPIPKR